jgi:hypothetical protein
MTTYTLEYDIGVQLLYFLYTKKVTPDVMQNIKHELLKESAVLYYLSNKGVDIMQVASALYKEEKGNGA